MLTMWHGAQARGRAARIAIMEAQAQRRCERSMSDSAVVTDTTGKYD
jgi:hypothetical protein